MNAKLALKIGPAREWPLLRGGSIGDFLAIVGGCVGIGAGIGASAAYLSDYEPRWDRGVGLGSIVGLVTGLCLAMLDAGLGS